MAELHSEKCSTAVKWEKGVEVAWCFLWQGARGLGFP